MSRMEPSRKGKAIQVIDRAVSLLEAIGPQNSVPLTKLSAEAGLALSTTKRILDSLAMHGFVEQDSERGAYRLGSRLHFLAGQPPSQRRFVEIARPSLIDLMRRSSEDVGLAVLQGRHAIIIDRETGPEAMKIIETANDPVPLNCGYRRVLLAYQPEPWIEQYLESTHFPRYTRYTITDKNRIRRLLDEIRKTGICVSGGEYFKDARGVAAPVFDAGSELAGHPVCGDAVGTLLEASRQTALHPRRARRGRFVGAVTG